MADRALRSLGERVYLGDGLYAAFDGDRVVLTAKNGNLVYLRTDVLAALRAYAERLRATLDAAAKAGPAAADASPDGEVTL
jgi:hypothetical protein